MYAGPERGCGNGIGGHDGTIDSHQFQIILEGIKIDVRPIGDEAEPKLFAHEEKALQDVVVPRKLNRTAIAKVSDHAQACIDRRLQLV